LDAVDYTSILKACCTTPAAIELGQNIYKHIKDHLPNDKFDIILKTSLVNMFLKYVRPPFPFPCQSTNPIFYDLLEQRCKKPDLALELWTNKLPADRVLYLSVLMACADANR